MERQRGNVSPVLALRHQAGNNNNVNNNNNKKKNTREDAANVAASTAVLRWRPHLKLYRNI